MLIPVNVLIGPFLLLGGPSDQAGQSVFATLYMCTCLSLFLLIKILTSFAIGLLRNGK